MPTSLQAERQTAGSVQAGANVVFDLPLYSEGSITQNSTTGEITINQVGTFVIQWLLCVQSSVTSTGSVFGIRDYVLGITSAAPAFLGNAGELRWEGKYLTDE